MTNDEFMKIWREEIERLTQFQAKKGEEYSRNGDRLHNFKTGADFRHTTPEDFLLGLVSKPMINVEDMAQDSCLDRFHDYKLWQEKIGDLIIYGILLLACVKEREDAFTKSKILKKGE